MEELLARYLDGELNEDEAGALIRAAEEDPDVEQASSGVGAIVGGQDVRKPGAPRRARRHSSRRV